MAPIHSLLERRIQITLFAYIKHRCIFHNLVLLRIIYKINVIHSVYIAIYMMLLFVLRIPFVIEYTPFCDRVSSAHNITL